MLAEARLLQEELSRAFERQHWNLAVRRAQEVVELSLKGLLKALGTEYPRLHTVRWDGRDGRGKELASGVYLCRLRTGEQVETKKLALVR